MVSNYDKNVGKQPSLYIYVLHKKNGKKFLSGELNIIYYIIVKYSVL